MYQIIGKLWCSKRMMMFKVGLWWILMAFGGVPPKIRVKPVKPKFGRKRGTKNPAFMVYIILCWETTGPIQKQSSNSPINPPRNKGQSQKHRSNCRHLQTHRFWVMSSLEAPNWAAWDGLSHFSVFKIPILDLPNTFSRNLGTILGSDLISNRSGKKREKTPTKRIKKAIQPARIGPGHLIASLLGWFQSLTVTLQWRVFIIDISYIWNHMKSIEIPNLIHENGTDMSFFMPWAMGWTSPACTAEGKGHHALFLLGLESMETVTSYATCCMLLCLTGLTHHELSKCPCLCPHFPTMFFWSKIKNWWYRMLAWQACWIDHHYDHVEGHFWM